MERTVGESGLLQVVLHPEHVHYETCMLTHIETHILIKNKVLKANNMIVKQKYNRLINIIFNLMHQCYYRPFIWFFKRQSFSV